jgi:hypothetical protein
MYKLIRIHVVIGALSILTNNSKPIGVFDQTTYASMFYTEPKWLNDVKEFLRTCKIEGRLHAQQKQRLVKKIEPFTLKNGELYRMGQGNRLQRCLTTIEA